jgi:hypothetical protein
MLNPNMYNGFKTNSAINYILGDLSIETFDALLTSLLQLMIPKGLHSAPQINDHDYDSQYGGVTNSAMLYRALPLHLAYRWIKF